MALHRKKVFNAEDIPELHEGIKEAYEKNNERDEKKFNDSLKETKPEIKQKSVLRLTKDLIEAGNELKRQIEESRVEREEFKKLLNSKTEVKTEVKTEEPETPKEA